MPAGFTVEGYPCPRGIYSPGAVVGSAVYGIRRVSAGDRFRGVLAAQKCMEAVARVAVFALSGVYAGEYGFFQENKQPVSKCFQAFWFPERCEMEQ